VAPDDRAIVRFDGLIPGNRGSRSTGSWLEVYQAHGEELPIRAVVPDSSDRRRPGFIRQHHLEERRGDRVPKDVLDRRNRPADRAWCLHSEACCPAWFAHRPGEGMGLKVASRRAPPPSAVGGPPRAPGHPRAQFDCLAAAGTTSPMRNRTHLYVAVLDFPGRCRLGRFARSKDSPNGVICRQARGHALRGLFRTRSQPGST